jgi:exonuclease SbcD
MATEITTYIASAVAAIIKYMAQKLDPEIPAVLAAHLTVSAGIFSGSEKRAVYGTDPLLLPSQLAIEPFDYVALGHLHRFQNVNSQGFPPIVYAGSVERIDFGERKEEKGFCAVTIAGKYNTSYEFIKTPTRPFVYLETRLDPTSCQTEQILRHIKQHAIENAVIKIAYHVPQGKQDVVDLIKVEAALASAWYVAGILPIVQPTVRVQRSAVQTDMDVKTMLEFYFQTKPALKEKSSALIEKTLLLLQDIEENNDQIDQ